MRVGLWRKLSTKKNWWFWTVVLDKSLVSPLDCKEIHPVYPKGDQSCVFIGRTDAKAVTPICWPPDVKSWLIGKDSDAGRDWGQEEKGTKEDEMAGWHHRLHGRKFEWTPGVGDGQGGLACCNSWGHRVRHDWATELNWLTDLNLTRNSFLTIDQGALYTDLWSHQYYINSCISVLNDHYHCGVCPFTL